MSAVKTRGGPRSAAYREPESMPHTQADAVFRDPKSNSRAAYRRCTPRSAGTPKRIDAPENKKSGQLQKRNLAGGSVFPVGTPRFG